MNGVKTIMTCKEKIEMEKKTVSEVVSIILKAVTLAMGVAVTVLSCMGSLNEHTAFALLGIGLACAGAAMLKMGDGRKE